MIIGHSISDADGVIQAIDESVAAVLQRTQKDLIGRSYTAITHPDDLARNVVQVVALKPNGGSMRIRKRYVGGEGAIITLEVQVSRLGGCHTGHLVGTLSTIEPGAALSSPSGAAVISDLLNDDHMPHRLWRRAKELLGVMRARDAALGSDLFADHAWTTLLIVYVAEAESRIATVDTVAAELGLARSTLGRWLRVLQAKSLLEPLDGSLDALQLTRTGIDGVERLLATNHPVSVS